MRNRLLAGALALSVVFAVRVSTSGRDARAANG